MSIPKRKAEIIDKATELFFNQGYVGASIRDIVKAVGITNSTVYLYFKNKDEILFYIIIDIGSVLLKELQGVIDTYDDPVECLRMMIRKQICLVTEKRKEIKIYMEEQYQLPADLRRKAHEQHRRIYDVYFNVISRIEEKELARNIDKAVMTFSVFAMMNWVYRWYKDDSGLALEEISGNIIDLYFGGILKPEVLLERELKE
ncbi:MAG: TetR family transcriptional regulator [Deltaproteobacteria bacterium]|nr:TetR family transcriptional regulator [Candidatus Tharpella aukensis]